MQHCDTLSRLTFTHTLFYFCSLLLFNFFSVPTRMMHNTYNQCNWLIFSFYCYLLKITVQAFGCLFPDLVVAEEITRGFNMCSINYQLWWLQEPTIESGDFFLVSNTMQLFLPLFLSHWSSEAKWVTDRWIPIEAWTIWELQCNIMFK